jgi:hypothetical protein
MGQATSTEPLVPSKTNALIVHPDSGAIIHKDVRPPSQEGIPDSHTDAVRRVLFQYLKRQTRKRVDNVSNLYLVEMKTNLDNIPQFCRAFQYWSFAVRPPVSAAFVRTTLEWVTHHSNNKDKLVSLVESLERMSKAVFHGGLQTVPKMQGGTSLPAQSTNKASVVLLSDDLKEVLLTFTQTKSAFPFHTVDNSLVSPNLFIGNSLAAASMGFQRHTGLTVSTSYMFLGERVVPNGDVLYLVKLMGPKPGQVIGKAISWASRSNMPVKFEYPDAWKAVFTLPIAVRRFGFPGTQLAKFKRVLVYASTAQNQAAILAKLASRPKNIVFISSKSATKVTMSMNGSFAHPVITVPRTKTLEETVKYYGIMRIHMESCVEHSALCKSLRSEIPNLAIYANFSKWTGNTSTPFQRVNPALVAKKQGSPGFNEWLYKTYASVLQKLGQMPFECTPDGKPFRSQELAIFFGSPSCPSIARLLIVHRTGSGKTKIMQIILGKFHKNDMSKVVLVPTDELRRNFFNKLVNTKSKMSEFVRKSISALPNTGTVPHDVINDNVKAIMTLLGIRNNSGRYQLKFYKTYLQKKKLGEVTHPYGTETWAPGSPMRCESFSSIEGMFGIIDDTDSAFVEFENNLKAGKPCVPVGRLESQRMFQPAYRYKQDGVKSKAKLIKNPFDYKIVVIDEVHELWTRPSPTPVKRKMLRLMLKYAQGGNVTGLTATPIISGDTTHSQVLDLVKGTDADKSNSEGFISYFDELVEPLFPGTIPKLFQRLQGGTIPVFGRVIVSPLFGANYHKYLERAQEVRGNPSTKNLIALQTFLNTIYTNMSAGRNGDKLVGPNLKDFAANANKLDCLDKLLTQHPTEKTLILFAGGARSYLEYVKRKYPGRVMRGEDGPPTTEQDRMGFMFRLSDKKKSQAQTEMLGWFNASYNLEGKFIRVMCANAQRFGTGVDFTAIRRIILVNIPQDVTRYLYAPLAKTDQNVHVDIMMATLDPHRTLKDLTDKDQYAALLREHGKNPRKPKLTYDEIHLRKLYNTFDGEMGQLKRLIADPAIDKPWLQNLVPLGKVDDEQDESKYVVYCDSSKAVEDQVNRDAKDAAKNPTKKQKVTIPSGKTGSLANLLENLNVPSKANAELPGMLNPTALIQGFIVDSKEELVDALIRQNAIGLLTTKPFVFDRDADSYTHRCNVRWAELAKFVPNLTQVQSIQFYILASESVTLISYTTNVFVDTESRNLKAVASALGLSTSVQRPTTQPVTYQVDETHPSAQVEDSDAVVVKLKQQAYDAVLGEPQKQADPQVQNGIDPNQQVVVFVNMYFPDILMILENRVLLYNEYQYQTVYTTGVLNRIKQVLSNFFQPYNKTIKVQGNRSQISAQVQNVSLAWLNAMESEQHRLFYQLGHLDELGSEGGWQIMPYTGKLEISLTPVELETTGYLEAKEILSVNDGNVYLDEDNTIQRMQVKNAPLPLSTHLKSGAFDSDPDFIQARFRRQSFVYLTKQDPPLIVPVNAYASIKDFATRASLREWNDLWRFVQQVRTSHGPDRVYLSTDPIEERAHFALNVLTQPGYPTWKLTEWKLRQAEREQLARVVKLEEELPLEKTAPVLRDANTEPPVQVPAVKLPEDKIKAPLVGSKMKPKEVPKDTLLTLILVYDEMPGVNQILFAERMTALDTKLLLPMARINKNLVSTEQGVEQVLERAVQRDALYPVDIKWLRTNSDPVALVKLSPGSTINRLGYSPDGHFTGRHPWFVSKLPALPSNLDGRSREIISLYTAQILKMAL